ncbi:hypothetical protein DFX99_16760 [Escherichia coli]|uniref:hypothetical protein n=1 Tax=Escherichia coli TaxID=562 RepID=UPI00101F1DAC|nr:hypothetical protein [Escherichia coli]EEV6194372.1 hypothetical protein [Escherichia coli]EFB1446156.1 hypothetical protein [Escherichia coli]EKG2067713.1 hypothetical protein [Escherichia coli]EKR5201124.1 hypothetical protein [Escherichia coli]EKS5468596.1 hypothetical protein [Escherichia coli]
MRKDGLNDFYEVNFLKLREIDATYPSEPIRYADLADIYSFINFKDAECEKIPPDEISTKKRKTQVTDGYACNLLSDILKYENSLRPGSHRSLAVTNKYLKLHCEAIPEYKEELKKNLIHKEDVLLKIQTEHDKIKNKVSGKITIIPISFHLNRKTNGTLEYIIDDLTMINMAFASTMSKIKHRTMYSRIAGHVRLGMLDENFEPFAHVLFFIQHGTVSHDFIREIIEVWYSFIPEDIECLVGVSGFDFNFLLNFQREVINEQKNSSTPGGITFFISDILNPFPDVTAKGYRNNEPCTLFSSLVRRTEMEDNRNKNPNRRVADREAEIATTKKKSGYDKLKNTPSIHREYFLRIAKKVNKIPFMRTIN